MKSVKYEEEFNFHFLINEDSLKRFSSIIENTIQGEFPKDDEIKLIYSVIREDKISYKTENIDDVLNDTNSERKLIRRLEISTSPRYSNFNIEVEFRIGGKYSSRQDDKDPEIEVSMSSGNMKNVDHFAKQISEEILRLKNTPLTYAKELVFIPYFFVCWALSYNMLILFGLDNYIEIDDKLNPTLLLAIASFFVSYVLTALISTKLSEVFDKIQSNTVFLLGDQIKSYQSKMTFRKNVFWSGTFALLISLTASFFSTYIFA
ncbi:hypothetical protein tinsulaeT_38880 [Thalassotalea insulae]|uniref:Uncharacterized protein n=1 Tax=Thalassotalea insulae TaxID=2056778 RepID=A0ABQ6GX80_9GAMM|nr:hypothetical protein [Thalassotalea insulae]GLX80548.1 hypothetical protein tinsulaeT_38880 [Thalassotalea insulae]